MNEDDFGLSVCCAPVEPSRPHTTPGSQARVKHVQARAVTQPEPVGVCRVFIFKDTGVPAPPLRSRCRTRLSADRPPWQLPRWSGGLSLDSEWSDSDSESESESGGLGVGSPAPGDQDSLCVTFCAVFIFSTVPACPATLAPSQAPSPGSYFVVRVGLAFGPSPALLMRC